jgi:enoyl-CoA hydratase/carnithine racemase
VTKPAYANTYANLAFTRDDDGVLVLRFHTNGGPVVFTGQTHEEFPAALEQISLDRNNRALVITGTGGSFMDQIDGPSLGEIFKPAVWEKIRVEGAKVLQRLLELPLPVVGVANGPATVHSEYLLHADVHIASERATYGDQPHPAFGITGGDGLHVAWEEIVGTARAKWLSGRASRSTRRRRCSGASSARWYRTSARSKGASRSRARSPRRRRSTGRCKNRRPT